MDVKAVAKQIRQAIFDRAEADGRVMHGDAIDEVIEGVLAKASAAPAPYMATRNYVEMRDGKICSVNLAPGGLNFLPDGEWR